MRNYASKTFVESLVLPCLTWICKGENGCEYFKSFDQRIYIPVQTIHICLQHWNWIEGMKRLIKGTFPTEQIFL